MKKSLLLLIFLFGLGIHSRACNLSDIQLLDVNFDGTNYTITMEMNIGGGILGAVRGADNWTGTLAYGVYSTDPSITFVGFTPASITSDTTTCTQPSTTFTGSFGANFGVAYINPGSCFYTCVSSTALCGKPHTQTDTLTITTNLLPDSIVFYGIEGTGNPVAGCYDLPDMMIDFSMTLPVDWGQLQTKKEEEHAIITWSTYYEQDNNFFQIERSADAENWDHIGTVNAVGYSRSINHYGFTDYEPLANVSYYRVKQVDIDGAYTYSDIAGFNNNPTFKVEAMPNPISDKISLNSTQSLAGYQLSIYNTNGQMVHQQTCVGSNAEEVLVSGLQAGVYYIKVHHPLATELIRVVKM